MTEIDQKTTDEIRNEFPEELAKKTKPLDTSAKNRPKPSDITYIIINIDDDTVQRSVVKRIHNEVFDSRTSWDTVNRRITKLQEEGIVSQKPSNDDWYELSEWTMDKLEDNTPNGETDTTSNQMSPISETEPQRTEPEQSTYIGKLLNSDQGGLFLMSLSIISFGGIFFMGGGLLLWVDVWTTSGEIMGSIGIISIIGATVLLLYLFYKHFWEDLDLLDRAFQN